ncbi:cytochrome ubiquinol oxidase subunit I [Kyrpidia spormannii]|uniref:Cytochrome ubiquinol oxidase subunit I n=1 Tax=Kyrpidia spormannii TaxID=2055160 RepID=A0A2K8N4A5_9BACL|nr:cytochrome ubiquinol oxidase subunit I [Kyrpidia spormannii]ATY84253.1 cytochrome ubiquinol oxidase subunit I [Kyrpidia spormannii]
MSHLLWARILMATSLGFHIIFATFGVGMPLMIALAETAALWRKDQLYARLAQRWTRGFVVLLAAGVVSGTIVAVQLTLLWPRFMELVGQIISTPFLIEVFAFFLEAIFTAVYVYGGDRISHKRRLAAALLVTLGAGASAILITDVNAFMNTPAGFVPDGGRPMDVRPWEAVFNPSFPTMVFHVLVSAYMTVAFVLAAIAAKQLLGSPSATAAAYHRKAMMLCLGVAGIMTVLTVIAGDLAGKHLAAHQPIKLAAAEGLFHTQTHAPLVIAGWPDPVSGQVIGGIQLLGWLSWLATGRFSGKVQGLLDFPVDQWPPLFVHWIFDAMVAVGVWGLLVAGAAAVAAGRERKGKGEFPPWLLWPVVSCGPLSVIGIELGWVFDEIGRQPWTVTGLLRTADAVTPTPGVPWIAALFIALYAVLAWGTATVIRAYFRRHPVDFDDGGGGAPPRSVREGAWLP